MQESSIVLFNVDSKTGVITLKSTLDYENVKEHVLYVKAEDSGSPKLAGKSSFYDFGPLIMRRHVYSYENKILCLNPVLPEALEKRGYRGGNLLLQSTWLTREKSPSGTLSASHSKATISIVQVWFGHLPPRCRYIVHLLALFA